MLEGDWKKAEGLGSETRHWTKSHCDAGAIYNFRICAENTNGCSAMVELKEPIKVLGTKHGCFPLTIHSLYFT